MLGGVDHVARLGRPRSEQARTAVLHAVDDLLLDVGYSAMTMKGIAERAGVGRQTVYRWWSTKAEILFEASVIDAAQELAVEPVSDLQIDATAFLARVVTFLTESPAGAAYRALLGEAQHDPAVAALVATTDVVGDAARRVLSAAGIAGDEVDEAAAALVGPVFFWVLSGRDPREIDVASLVGRFTAGLATRHR